jgi:5-methylcytosine-specific restriction endonuclease McrA
VADAISSFSGAGQPNVEHWRSIVLFGRNVASYKFALAKSLLELGKGEETFVPIEKLAQPFASHLCEHLASVDRQGTFQRSRFLDACRYYNAGRINADELRTVTVTLGFSNVIDAFHVVGDGDVATRFFMDERRHGGITLTDEMLQLATELDAPDLQSEAEARWRLVEEAWSARADGDQITVLYDAPRELLVPSLAGKRRPIAEARAALNGYQKGRCFYCFRSMRIGVIPPSDVDASAHVDHFIPLVLNARGLPIDLDQVWNLVLACDNCNLSKGSTLPGEQYLPRLHTRNEFLISSYHPLRETLMDQTGHREPDRRLFLTSTMRDALDYVRSALWTAPTQGRVLF